MALYTDEILPRCLHFALSRAPIMELRARVTRGLSGRVLEVGFGSGLNLPYYPASVTQIVGIEPSRVARQLARKRIQARAIPLAWLELQGESLQLPAASIDAVLSTFTLCTIPNVGAALRELKRVLKPCGKLHFLEHGKSPEASVARWQARLNPLQQKLAGGCNLNRAIPDLVRDAGFCLDALDTYYMPGPRVASYFYEGRACACDKNVEA